MSSQVNSNFDSLFNWVNGSGVWADGSVAFTGVPVLPAVDPTTVNQAVRKAYSDGILFGAGGGLAGGAPTLPVRPLIQGNLAVATTDGSGNVTITFPNAFPNGLLFAFAWPWENGGVKPWKCSMGAGIGSGSKTAVAFTLWNTSTNAAVTGQILSYNWFALGW